MYKRPFLALLAQALLGFWIVLPLPSAAKEKEKPPKVTREETRKAKAEIELKAIRLLVEEQQRLDKVGFRTLRALSAEVDKPGFPYCGLLVDDASSKQGRRVAEALGVQEKSKPFVYSVTEGGPAWEAGFRVGDVILEWNGRAARRARDLAEALWKEESYDPLVIRRARSDKSGPLAIRPVRLAWRISFVVLPGDVLNAFTVPADFRKTREVGVIRFYKGFMDLLRSDNELAVVVGHEIAHLALGHLTYKKLLLQSALNLGGLAVPGWGSIPSGMAGQAVGARFSRGQERAADFAGLCYAHSSGYDVTAGVEVWERFAIAQPQTKKGTLWSTHPTSPERMVRARKVAESLKKGEPLPEEPDEGRETTPPSDSGSRETRGTGRGDHAKHRATL